MAQGYTGYTIVGRQVSIEDGPNLDSFSRLRVSNPLTIFSNQFTYDLSPLLFEPVYTLNASVTHQPDRLAQLDFVGAGPGETVYMQSYEYIPYQPGRSQLVFITFNMFPGGPGTYISDIQKYAGLGDDYNGFFFQWNGVTFQFLLRNPGSTGNQTADQNNWNLDKLNGSGPSGITIDFSKTQILVIDFQALYVGRVRFGFDIDGQIIYAHEFLNANVQTYPYIQTANLPIKIGMLFTGGGPYTDSLFFICCSVASEGGVEDAQRFGYEFSVGATKNITTVNNTNYLMALQPALTFNGLTNRTKFILEDIEFLNLTKEPVKWYLVVGENVDLYAPTWNNVNATYSATNYDTAATGFAVPFSPGGIIIDEGYVPGSSGAVRGTTSSQSTSSRYPITLNAAGTTRPFGTLSLWANVLSGVNTDLYFSMKWKEIR